MGVDTIYRFECDSCATSTSQSSSVPPTGWCKTDMNIARLHNPYVLPGGGFNGVMLLCGNCGTKLIDFLIAFGAPEIKQHDPV